MGQMLHGCATTTEAIHRAIQHSQASLRQLARRYEVNPKTVAKWKKCSAGGLFGSREKSHPITVATAMIAAIRIWCAYPQE